MGSGGTALPLFAAFFHADAPRFYELGAPGVSAWLDRAGEKYGRIGFSSSYARLSEVRLLMARPRAKNKSAQTGYIPLAIPYTNI